MKCCLYILYVCVCVHMRLSARKRERVRMRNEYRKISLKYVNIARAARRKMRKKNEISRCKNKKQK